MCMSADSHAAVDDMVGHTQAAGGVGDPGPKQDYGFMYGRRVEASSRPHLGDDVDRRAAASRRGAQRPPLD